MKEFNYEEMLAQRKAQAETQAKDYFYNKKQRNAYYWAGGSNFNDLECDNEAFLHFTDEEVSRIKVLIIEDVNNSHITPHPVKTVKEALEVLTFSDLFDQNEELRNLLLDRCEHANIFPSEIDFDTKHYFYKFGCLAYDYKGNHVLNSVSADVPLSDEDYLTLLSLQIQDRENFNFNQLLKSNPELAIKLNNAVEGRVYGWCFPLHLPFTILFDEVRADAEIIDGPIPADDEIYSEITDEHMFHVQASASSHILTITEEEMKSGANFATQRILNDIDADKVMKHLEANDYEDMLLKLNYDFNKREAFDNIKSWLSNHEISFYEYKSK